MRPLHPTMQARAQRQARGEAAPTIEGLRAYAIERRQDAALGRAQAHWLEAIGRELHRTDPDEHAEANLYATARVHLKSAEEDEDNAARAEALADEMETQRLQRRINR